MRITPLEGRSAYFRTQEVAHVILFSFKTEHPWGSTSTTYVADCGLRKNASTWLYLYEEQPEGIRLCKKCAPEIK